MAQSLSRGTVYLMVAELVALLSSYGVQVGVAKFLGPESYGIFGVITSLYLINRAFLNTGIPRATSKFIAESKDKVGAIFQTSIKVQWAAAALFALFYVIFARVIASFLKDISLTYYIIYLGIMVIPFSFLALYSTGYLNGMHRFKEQARIKMLYPFLQAVFTFILVWWGFRIYGIITGYFLAVLVGLFISWRYVRIKADGSPPFSAKKLIHFAIPISLTALCFTLLRHVNPLFVKYFLVDNATVGLFTAAATLSSIPFSIFGALPVTLLPAISRSLGENNLIQARAYISKSIRYSLLILLPLSALVAAFSREVLGLFYPAGYEAAGSTLAILIFASSFLALFTTLNAVLVGSGRPLLQLTTVFITVVLLSSLNIVLLPRYGIIGSALASLFASIFAVILESFHIHRYFGKFVDYLSLFRIILASSGLFIVGYYWHYSGWLLIPQVIFLSLMGILFLFFIGELTRADWEFGQKIFFWWR